MSAELYHPIAFLVSMNVVLWSTPAVKNFGLKSGHVDRPNDRKVHQRPMVRLGGVSIFSGTISALAIVWLFGGFDTIDRATQWEILGAILGGCGFFLIGLGDDVFNLTAISRLVMQSIVAAGAWYMGVGIDFLSVPFYDPVQLGWLSLPVTIIWLVGMANAINWIDGLDGLAAGVSGISALVMLVVALFMEQPAAAMIAAALAGGALGFLRYNFNPAEIFMGDGGAYFMGFTLAAVGAIGLVKTTAVTGVLLPYLILAVPILDMSTVILSRIKHGKSPFVADKRHLHHRLLQAGIPQRLTVVFIYALTFWLGSLALGFSGIPSGWGYALGATMLLVYLSWEVKRKSRNNEQFSMNNEQQTMNNKQQTTNNKQQTLRLRSVQATNNKQQITNNKGKAEVICVGTELLLGDILNSNSQFLGIELAALGIPHYYQTVVGDNIQRVQEAIAIASKRSSILIFTGGLGPTPDDLTTEAIASFFEVPLVEREEIVQDIAAKFAQRGREMKANNRKQALIPTGAEILPNPIGTAPGIIWQVEPHLTIFTFPGVPGEMKRMWRETAVPYLKSLGWGQEIIYSRMLRFRGIGESTLAAKVERFFDSTNPTVAPYASKGEVRLRVTAKAASQEEAVALIEPVAEQIQAIAGLDYFGADEDTLASVVGQLLRDRGETLSVAESCTGGGLGEILTTTPGSSDYFLGGIIAYANQLKIALLGIEPEDLEKFGAVSAVVARQMAVGVQKQTNSHWGLSITGIAGPGGGTESKPVGLVYVGLAGKDGTAETFEYGFGQERSRSLIRYLSACNALDALRRKLAPQ